MSTSNLHQKGSGRPLEVRLRDGESIEDLIARFRRGVQRSGVLQEFRRRARFVSNGELQRIAARKSARRAARRARKAERRTGRGKS